MVAFKNKGMALCEVVFDQPGDPAGIGTVAKPELTVGDDKADRIRRIVRYSKRMDLQATELEPFAGAEFTGRKGFAELPGCGPVGGRIGVHRDTGLPGDNSHTGKVIIVFMGDQHRGKPVRPPAEDGQPPLDFQPGKPGIDEQRRPAALDKGTVPPAAAAKHTELHIAGWNPPPLVDLQIPV